MNNLYRRMKLIFVVKKNYKMTNEFYVKKTLKIFKKKIKLKVV